METVLLSEWLVTSTAFCFDALFSSHICFSHSLFSHTSCYSLISILINALKKCGGNRWLAKANVQSSTPWSHGESASAVSWDLLWDLIPQLYGHLGQQPSCLAPLGSAPVWPVPRVHVYTWSPHASPHHIPRSCWRQSVKQQMEVKEHTVPFPHSRLLFSSGVDITK